jgi:hypothetical protein
MTLAQARETYLGKVCDIDWTPIDRKLRPNEPVMRPTLGIVVSEIYQNCYGEIMFRCKDKIYTPFPIERLRNPR